MIPEMAFENNEDLSEEELEHLLGDLIFDQYITYGEVREALENKGFDEQLSKEHFEELVYLCLSSIFDDFEDVDLDLFEEEE